MSTNHLMNFYNEFTKTFNCFDLSALCKRYKVGILAMDTNQTSRIVKYGKHKWYLSADKVERA